MDYHEITIMRQGQLVRNIDFLADDDIANKALEIVNGLHYMEYMDSDTVILSMGDLDDIIDGMIEKYYRGDSQCESK